MINKSLYIAGWTYESDFVFDAFIYIAYITIICVGSIGHNNV